MQMKMKGGKGGPAQGQNKRGCSCLTGCSDVPPAAVSGMMVRLPFRGNRMDSLPQTKLTLISLSPWRALPERYP